MKKRFNDFAASDADAPNDAPCPRPTRASRRGCFGRFFRTAALLVALLVVALGSFAAFFYWRSVSAPIDVENASTGDLVGWLAFRDLSAETPETRERLFDRYVETLDGDGDGEGVDPERIELSPQARQAARAFFQREAERKANARPADAGRAPYLRLDYYVAPRNADSPQKSEYVLSDDVRPGPALLKRWNASREKRQTGDASTKKTPAVEKNVRLLVMQWFVAKRKAYDDAPDAEKARRLEQTVDELLGWQELYEKIYLDATQTAATRAEMLAEFEKTVDSWNEFETPEELAKILWFKDLIVANVAARETPLGRLTSPEPPRARKVAPADSAADSDSAATNENATVETSENAAPTGRDFGRQALDAARRFLFGTPAPEPPVDAPTR